MKNQKVEFQGAEVVSTACKALSDKQCGAKLGCMFSQRSQTCVDATHWQCVTKKTVMDCSVHRELAPVGLPVRADKLCGSMLLGQTPSTFKSCTGGLRAKHTCDQDTDCPGSTCSEYKSVQGCASKIVSQCGAQGFGEMASVIV
jgi:hypothetical protein